MTETISLMIVKRNGDVVGFESEKIKNAIMKAVRATDNKIEEELMDKLIFDIQQEIEARFIDFYPNVENVQDIVEKNLVKNGLYEISKAYILYREKRKLEREKEKVENQKKVQLGRLKVKKSDGTAVLFDLGKIKESILAAARGYEKDISADSIIKELVKNIYDGITTEDIQKSLILASVTFIEKDPAYNYVSGRLFLQKLFKEATGESILKAGKSENYKKAFIYGIQKGVEENLFDKRLLNFDLIKLGNALKIERDELLQFMGIQTLYERYFAKVGEKRIEMPQGFWMRVAMGLSIKEKNKDEKAIEFYDLLSSLRYVSSTPTLFHSGTLHPQLSSCYLNTVMDDLHHIFKVYGDNAQLSKWSGGIGTDWTNVRATGATIKTNGVSSQGTIPFLKIANDVTVAINRSGKRRGATCVYLETWHLDIEDFLDLKKNTGDERRRTHDMNTANWIPDLFMKRVLNDEEWTLFSPEEVPELHHLYGRKFEKKYEEYEEAARNGKIKKHKTVSALKLWKKMLSMLFETGHPWITFKDPCNIRSPQDHVGVIHNSNLCTEITLNTSEKETAVCNLGSINFGKHIINNQLDKELIAKTVRTAVRMLDNVIDINFYPTIEAEMSNLQHRPIGFGIMGFQDALYMLDIDFGSPEAVTFADKSMELVSYYAILASSELAKERGKYESYSGSKWDKGIFPLDTLNLVEEERGLKINVSRDESLDWTPVRMHVKQFGMRNSNVMAIAPTATISTISGCYPCIEPIYKNIYVKANMSGEFTVVNPYLIEDLKKNGLWNQEMLEQLKYYDGNVGLIAGIPDELKRKYKEVFDIDAKHLIDITAARGKWIDQSQSFNLFIKGVSGTKLSETYLYAWEKGLKTTYYLRSLAASQIEKSTLNAEKYGFTQKREYKNFDVSEKIQEVERLKEITTKQRAAASNFDLEIGNEMSATEFTNGKICSLLDPDCEACQ
ncbi:MAG: ribonucleoside-diphosphate reductase subunit alpha [Nanoarchaeota archaeon]|nr:ribonucleoside-diphosphate reductase subunit alpha [Nanoarchaeota archaeon]